ncbi:MAG: HAMP domain-containing sensor histidine kinase [Planctomycetota bacterium]
MGKSTRRSLAACLIGLAILLAAGTQWLPRPEVASKEDDLNTIRAGFERWRLTVDEALDRLATNSGQDPSFSSESLERVRQAWPERSFLEWRRTGLPRAWAGSPPPPFDSAPPRGLHRIGSTWWWLDQRPLPSGGTLRAGIALLSQWPPVHPLAPRSAALDEIEDELHVLSGWWISEAPAKQSGVGSAPLDDDHAIVFEPPSEEAIGHALQSRERRFRDRLFAGAALASWLAVLLFLPWVGGRHRYWMRAIAIAITLALRVVLGHLRLAGLPPENSVWSATWLSSTRLNDLVTNLVGSRLPGWLALETWFLTPADFAMSCATLGAIGFFLSAMRRSPEHPLEPTRWSLGLRWVASLSGGFFLAVALEWLLEVATLDATYDLLQPVADDSSGARLLVLLGLFAATLGAAFALARAWGGSNGRVRAIFVISGWIGCTLGFSESALVARLIQSGGLTALSIALVADWLRRGGLVLPISAILVSLTLYPGIQSLTQRDREERIAAEVLLQPDPESVFRNALWDLVTTGDSDPAVRRIRERGGDPDDVAFALWAVSTFGSHGWPARILYSPPSGTGTVEIGLPPSSDRPSQLATRPWPEAGSEPEVGPFGEDYTTGRRWWYARHFFEGGASIEVQAPFSRRSTLLASRRGAPVLDETIRIALLGVEDSERYDAPPANLRPPDGLSELEPDGPGLWTTQRIDGRLYRCYFVRRSQPDRRLVAYTPVPTTLEIVRDGASLLALYAALAALPGLALVLFRWRRRRTLESRILFSYVFVSLVPIGGLAWLESGNAREEQQLQLEREADRLFDLLTREVERGRNPLGVQTVDKDWCLGMSQLLGTEVSVYREGHLVREGRDVASSLPTLAHRDIVPDRLPGPTFDLMEREGLREHLAPVELGELALWTTFRRTDNLTGETGDIVGLTLSSTRDTIARDQERRLALSLMGLFVAIIGIWIVAVWLARRLSAPLRRLRRGTEQVAAGHWSVRLEEGREGQEIRELVRAFNVMIEELERSREQQLRLQREQAWREMARQVAHDIKNSLTPMKLSLQHLQRLLADRAAQLPETAGRAGRHLLAEIDALSDIADKFREFARDADGGTPVSREPIELGELLRDVVSLFQETFAQNEVSVGLEVEDDLPPLHAERSGLRRVFNNLLTNALQALSDRPRKNISIVARRLNDSVEVTFEDSGPGFSPDVLPRLFEPSFSTKTSGSGLGLAICRAIVQDHGGMIEATNSSTGGARIRIVLPAEESTGG